MTKLYNHDCQLFKMEVFIYFPRDKNIICVEKNYKQEKKDQTIVSDKSKVLQIQINMNIKLVYVCCSNNIIKPV